MTETVPEDVCELAQRAALSSKNFDRLTSAIEQAIMADRASRPAAVPEGWRLVPEEPTEEMIAAAWQATRYVSAERRMKLALVSTEHAHNVKMKDRYKAMLAAAPAAPQASNAEPVDKEALKTAIRDILIHAAISGVADVDRKAAFEAILEDEDYAQQLADIAETIVETVPLYAAPQAKAGTEELVELLRRVPSVMTDQFAAGSEEREFGSARRQARLMKRGEKLLSDIRAAIAKHGGRS